jgi:hypothetical protein
MKHRLCNRKKTPLPELELEAEALVGCKERQSVEEAEEDVVR